MATKKKTERVFVNPFSDTFIPMWELWKEYKLTEFKFKYKSPITEQTAINYLCELSGGQEDTASQIIKQSIAHGWKGFFNLKTININTNGQQRANQQSTNATRESVNEVFDRHFRKE